MWLPINNKIEDDKHFLILGKCLLLCQKFESTCKYFIMMMSLTKRIAVDKDLKLQSSEAKDYVDKLLSMLLGPSINYYQNFFNGTAEMKEIEYLRKGKNARNYIIHESAINFIHSLHNNNKFRWDIRKLKREISTIAKADYYVSRWTYEYLEKQSGSFYTQEEYERKINIWVFDKNTPANVLNIRINDNEQE